LQEVLSIKENFSLIGLVETHYTLRQYGLTASTLANDHIHFSFQESEADIGQHLCVSKGLIQVLNLNQISRSWVTI
jgi:hypothetical protein